MTKLSDKEKHILLYLITNCEIYQLDEKQALEYIKIKFSRMISRRTYYNYKNYVYKDHIKGSPFFGLLRFLGSKKSSKNLTSLSLISYKDYLIKEGLNKNIKPIEFSILEEYKLSLKKFYEKAGSIIKQGEKLLVNMNSKRQIARKNSKSLPNNATIRKEYVKCGKEFCLGCKHGPYYYAYWRDEIGELKKKYIGRNDPRKREIGIYENYSNDLEHILNNKPNDLEKNVH